MISKNHVHVWEWNKPPEALDCTKCGEYLDCGNIVEHMNTLEAENAELRERMRWVPVGERLPKEKQDVLALDRTGTAYHWQYSRSLSNIFVGDYTHWMPLPEAPKEDA